MSVLMASIKYSVKVTQDIIVGKIALCTRADSTARIGSGPVNDSRHRYANNLHPYHEKWRNSSTSQDFFFWLDFGDGKEFDLEECPRSKLDQQCVKYFGPKEREPYEYVVVDGKILHKMTGTPLQHGSPNLKYIFVVSTDKKLYIGKKEKGIFHHSSFLAGGDTLTAGRLFVEDGLLKRISPFSGHYKPTEDSLERFLSILKKKGVNLDEVQVRRRQGSSLSSLTGEDLHGNGYVNSEKLHAVSGLGVTGWSQMGDVAGLDL
ncbi:Hypothetical predicted protein [Olea europaea subsp. europaea]|uniref:Uncharacterized protein n=1 Tax=Olea europaea subsp. europaea TaxID=158383 RepID=A0A8S0RGC8_OLEEU|nr:Hypothetical predicted protein [Olea europaea subsp. europaea]